MFLRINLSSGISTDVSLIENNSTTSNYHATKKERKITFGRKLDYSQCMFTTFFTYFLTLKFQ